MEEIEDMNHSGQGQNKVMQDNYESSHEADLATKDLKVIKGQIHFFFLYDNPDYHEIVALLPLPVTGNLHPVPSL